MKLAYQYVVLRCVPRPDREEFLNVGVVLYCQAADFLDAVWHVDADRLRSLDAGIDVDQVCEALAFVDGVCRGDDRGGEAARQSLGQRFGFLKAPAQHGAPARPGPRRDDRRPGTSARAPARATRRLMLVAAVRADLAAAGDPDRAAQQQAYMKSDLPYRGLSSPQLKAVLRPLLAEHRFTEREDWEAAVRELWDGATHREEWYAAIALLRHRPTARGSTPGCCRCSSTWCAPVPGGTSSTRSRPTSSGRCSWSTGPDVTGVMADWAVDEHMWVRRSAMLSQLRHKQQTDTDLLRRVLDANLDDTTYGQEFFIRKALGWALREHAQDRSGVGPRLPADPRRSAERTVTPGGEQAPRPEAAQTGTSSTAPTA